MTPQKSGTEKRTERVVVRVTPSREEKWLEALEQTEHSDLSSMIRAAVQSYMHQFTEIDVIGHPRTAETGGGSLDVDLEPIQQNLTQIHERLDSLEAGIREIESSDHDIDELAMRIERILPAEDEISDKGTELVHEVDASNDIERAKQIATPPAIADALDVPETRTREALKKLVEDIGHIKTIEINKTTRYYREEDTGNERG